MKYFKLNKIRRFIILGVTAVAAILAIALGSSLYVSKNARKSIEYGGGAEYVVRIVPEGSHAADKAKLMATDVAQEIYERIDSLGIAGATANPEISDDGARVRVTYPGVATEEQRKEVEKLITEKPTLTFTDVYGNPLFDANQNFHTSLRGHHELMIDPTSKSVLPLVSGGAHSIYSADKYQVAINLIPAKSAEWTKATQYLSTLPKGQNQVIAWLNLKEFISTMKTKWPTIWSAANGNPLVAAKVSAGKDKASVLREHTIDASKYLISQATVAQVLSGRSFVIEGSFNQAQAKDLAKKINYGASHYKLKTEYSNYIGATYGTDAFHKAMIAGVIVFALIAVFLIANYGLLGALSTISIALYVFITLAMFTVMRGEYSPEAIAALIIGIGMAVDANIITFERLKSEVYSGSSLQKGFKDANKKSLSTIFDANITTLIVAFVLFFFGTRNIVGLSVTLILSIVLTLIVMLGFTRFASTMLVRTGVFDNKQHLLGMKPKFDVKVQKKIDKFDYIKNAKWFTLGSAVIFTAGIIVLAVTAAIAGHFSGGFNLSQDFTGGTILQLIPGEHSNSISATDAKAFTDFLATKGINPADITTTMSGTDIVSMKYQTVDTFANVTDWKTQFAALSSSDVKFTQSITTSDVAQKILKDAMIAVAIAIAGIIIYTLIRFKWTYSIAAIIALVHDALIVVAVFVIARVEISPVFIAGLLSIIGYSINDTIVTFDRLRENMNLEVGNVSKERIKEIANKSIKETLKRSLLTSLTTILSIVVLMAFGNATKMSFNLAMLVGLIAGTYSSIFIATYLWTKLETRRQNAIVSRGEKKFWDTNEPEEQTFKGINEFNS